MCPAEITLKDSLKNKILNVLETSNTFEGPLNCTYLVAEKLAYDLNDLGLRTQVYEEFGKICIGVWKKEN